MILIFHVIYTIVANYVIVIRLKNSSLTSLFFSTKKTLKKTYYLIRRQFDVIENQCFVLTKQKGTDGKPYKMEQRNLDLRWYFSFFLF